MDCAGCPATEYEVIQNYLNKDKEALKVFESHGIIPTKRRCERCNTELEVNSEERHFRCYKRFKRDPKSKKVTRCNYFASQNKDTWLDKAKLEPSKNLLFINAFLRKSFTQALCEKNIGLRPATIVDWKSFCSEVCVNWLDNQEPIGGPGKVVEIDESKFGKRKYNVGRLVDGVWVFGGVERGTKRRFVLPVEKRNAATLIPLCKKYILPGTTVYSDSWRAYSSLKDEGYTHFVVNHSKHFVDPETGIHTNNIERVWKDIKSWVLRPGNKKSHYKQYFARYLFAYEHPDHKTILHHFLQEIARLYPPPQ